MKIRGIDFPVIDIRNRHDIDIVVRYIRTNKNEFNGSVDRWLKDNLNGNKDLIDYYRIKMSDTFRQYKSIEKKD